ncbi:hypothetical protein [Paenibacillus sp. NPDC058177]|uniref:hypothetical protein n=1 Tax=Paenibacillus sp. NPDC058177 TaxID=3346369 RepID=UPI0036DABA4A
MKKKWILFLATTISVTTALSAAVPVSNAGAESVKATTSYSNAVYYGETKNDLPNGKGKLEWSDKKWYSGEFVQGKRSGTGKYYNEYIGEYGRTYRLVYNGDWKNDRMNGSGTLTEKITEASGEVIQNSITTGEFVNDVWKSGYKVRHAVADPDFEFIYKGNETTISIWDTNGSLLEHWKEGKLFRVQYQKGSVYKEYWIFPTETAKEEKTKQASIRYLQSITSQVAPYLKKFEQFAKQVPLK